MVSEVQSISNKDLPPSRQKYYYFIVKLMCNIQKTFLINIYNISIDPPNTLEVRGGDQRWSTYN